MQLRAVLVTYRAEKRRLGIPSSAVLERSDAILRKVANEVDGDETLQRELEAVRREVLGGSA